MPRAGKRGVSALKTAASQRDTTRILSDTGSVQGLDQALAEVTFDWDNHFDRNFSALRPFADIGIGNTISDTHFFVRPFTTLGIVSHFQGGTTYRVFPFVRVGASLYDDLPSGQQKVFSKLKPRQPEVNWPRAMALDLLKTRTRLWDPLTSPAITGTRPGSRAARCPSSTSRGGTVAAFIMRSTRFRSMSE